MIVLKINFLTGRYHSTPWGRNVNEGVPEFPPSPYRIIRTVMDSWFRKRSGWSLILLENIAEKLSNEAPSFRIPPYKEGVLKSYMSRNTKDPTDKDLIYDGFISVLPNDPVYVIWENESLNEDEFFRLKEVVSIINYLGRSQSWVSMELMDGCDQSPNVIPLVRTAENSPYDEVVKVAIPVSKKDYGFNSKKPWFESLGITTSYIQSNGLSNPYAMKYENYIMKRGRNKTEAELPINYSIKKINIILYSVDTKVPPMISESLQVGERIHKKLNGIYGKMFQNTRSTNLSGLEQDGSMSRGHKHIFIMPLDLNGTGRISHILIRGRLPFDAKELIALDRLRSVWQSNGRPDIDLIPVEWGQEQNVSVISSSKRFMSVTPVILTRHYRKGRGDFNNWLKRELMLEIKDQGLPEPDLIKPLKKMIKNGRTYYWLDFKRNRKNDPINIGYGFEVTFKEDVYGPFSVGYGAHFGLGIFYPTEEGDKNGEQ